MAVMRSEYWNLSTNTVRTGATGHGESLIDVESYLLPMDRLRTSGLYGWGVAAGLRVTATPGTAGVTVSTGTALDAEGNLLVLTDGGAAVVDQAVDPDEIQNVPTVPVAATGVTVDSTGITGAVLLTVTWREAAGLGQLSNAPVLLHAPWLRLVPAAGFQDVGEQVVLAAATLGAGGVVTGLAAGARRQVSTPTGRLELRRPTTGTAGGLGVDQVPVAELVTRADGGVDLNLLPAAGPARRALSVDGGTGDVLITAALVADGLQVRDRLVVDAAGDVLVGGVLMADGLRVRDRLVVDAAGNVSVGGAQAQRVLHVEGSEVHSGGTAGGFSFADRAVGGLVESPGAGERWVWYAYGGSARLWSGQDRLSIGSAGEGGGLEVYRRMRVRQGGDASAGIWLFQSGPQADRAFVGMADDRHVGFWGNEGAGWALRMDVATGSLDVSDTFVHGALTTASGVRAGGGIVLLNGSGITGTGRVNISGPEPLYLGNQGGVVVGAAWGGGSLRVQGGSGNGWPESLPIPGWSGGGIGTWDLFARGAVYVGDDPDNPRCVFYSDGTKRFVIDHPLDPDHRTLTHACIEGPEAAVYYRGEGRLSGGDARVTLPDYFERLARAEGRTVMLTPVSDLGEPVCVLAATPVTDGGFTVLAADDRNSCQRFCWEVKATRADVDLLRVENEKVRSAIPMMELS